MRIVIIRLLCVLLSFSHASSHAQVDDIFYPADHPGFEYNGRIDFSDVKAPRFWQPGVYIRFRVRGMHCRIILRDEELWGKNHNYLELIVNGEARRLQTKSKNDTLVVDGLDQDTNEVTLVKNTEANIGYLDFLGVYCLKLMPRPFSPVRKIEFIGNSITCGAGADPSEVPCGKGVWHDQHNAWLSYGPTTARSLEAQYHLSSVSGIGLMHSCCNMKIIMPQVYDKVSMRNDSIVWDFKKYQPDVVTVCLGQNDGIQDSTAFCDNYISFLERVRGYYPKAMIVCLSSPMADPRLFAFAKKTINAIVDKMNKTDKRIKKYFFTKQYKNGCDYHPDLAEHASIAKELTAFIKKTMKW
jgi:hypothetical protein